MRFEVFTIFPELIDAYARVGLIAEKRHPSRDRGSLAIRPHRQHERPVVASRLQSELSHGELWSVSLSYGMLGVRGSAGREPQRRALFRAAGSERLARRADRAHRARLEHASDRVQDPSVCLGLSYGPGVVRTDTGSGSVALLIGPCSECDGVCAATCP
jgi:hypothetical protein